MELREECRVEFGVELGVELGADAKVEQGAWGHPSLVNTCSKAEPC